MLPGCSGKTQEDFRLGFEAQQPGQKDRHLHPVSIAEAPAGLLPPTGRSWRVLATPKKVYYQSYTVRNNRAVIDSIGGRKWQPTPVFLPRESQGRQSLVGCRLWSRTELDTTEAT